MGGFTGPATRGLGGKKYFSRNVDPVPAGGPGQVIFQIFATANSTGPYDTPQPCDLISGITQQPVPAGNAPLGTLTPHPILVNGAQMVVVGTVGIGVNWFYTVCLVGVHPQGFFTDISFATVGIGPMDLTAAAANFNTTFNQPGFSIWCWPQLVHAGGVMANNSDIIIAWP